MGDAEGGEPMAVDADRVFIVGSWAATHAGGTGHVSNGVDVMVVGEVSIELICMQPLTAPSSGWGQKPVLAEYRTGRRELLT